MVFLKGLVIHLQCRRREEEEDFHGSDDEGRGKGGKGRVSKPQTSHPALVPKPEPSPLLSGGETVAPSGAARIGRAAKPSKARRPFGTTAPVPIPPQHPTPHKQGCVPRRNYSIQIQLWLCSASCSCCLNSIHCRASIPTRMG